MRIAIPDDYQDCVRGLACFAKLAGHEVAIHHDTLHDTEALAARFANAEALVLTRERTAITAALLDRLPHLRLISQTGKLAGHVDLAACTARGVAVAEGQGSGAATAELTWALVLSSRRHLVAEANRLRAGQWQGFLGQQLQGQRLGVWSYGRIGRQVAAYGKAFGMKVWVWGRAGSTAQARADGVEVAPSREAFFAESDVVSLHVRLNAETRGLVTPARPGSDEAHRAVRQHQPRRTGSAGRTGPCTGRGKARLGRDGCLRAGAAARRSRPVAGVAERAVHAAHRLCGARQLRALLRHRLRPTSMPSPPAGPPA